MQTQLIPKINVESQSKLKKGAFRNKMRREWLDNYFHEKRTELLLLNKRQSEHQEQLNLRFHQLIKRLPQDDAINDLIVYSEENKTQLLKFVNLNLEYFTSTITEISSKAFTLYILILSQVTICYPSSKQQVLHFSLRKMIHQGRRLMKQNKIIAHVINLNLIELILLLSQTFCQMDQLLVQEICQILSQTLIYVDKSSTDDEIKQSHVRTMEIINQFLIASVKGLDEQEEQQNVNQDDARDLIYQKLLFIQKMFCQKGQNIKNIISWVSVNPSDQKTTLITLKVLTNLTYMSSNQQIYHQLFDANVQHLIFSGMTKFSGRQHVIIIVVRLINNLLVFNRDICEVRVESIQFWMLYKIFLREKQGKITLVEEICSMLSNIIHFMEDVPHTIIHLIQKKAFQILAYGCEHITDTQQLYHILMAFQTFLKYQKQTASAKIRQMHRVFQKIADQDDDLCVVAEMLLKESYKESPYFHSQDRDIQI